MQQKAKFILIIIITELMVLPLMAKTLDQYFDEYEKIDWKTEQIHLMNFEEYLINHPDMIGYIGFNWSSRAEYIEMKRRVARARRYLIRRGKISASRLVIIKGGKEVYPATILQPVRKEAPPPKFGWSLNRNNKP